MRKNAVINDINVYGLTRKNIPTLIVNRALVNKDHGFWRNDVVKAWCISAEQGPYFDCDEYWLGVYDEDASAYAGKICCEFSSHGGMCDYKFNKFFQKEDIKNDMDYLIQYKFIDAMNRLIAEGVFTCPWRENA